MKIVSTSFLTILLSISSFANEVVPGSKPQGRSSGSAVSRPTHSNRIRNPQTPSVINVDSGSSARRVRNQAADSSVSHQSRVMPQLPNVAHERIIYKFFGINTQLQKQDLESQLRRINEELRIAKADELLNRSSTCADINSVCVIVSDKALSAFQSSASSLPSHASVGMIAGLTRTHKVPSYTRQLKNPNQSSSSSSNRETGMYDPSFGSNSFSYDNPDPNFYYIPDLGNQYAGAYFPNMSGIISPTTMISQVTASISIYHTYHNDLRIYLGYDDGLNDYYEREFERPTGRSAGYQTYNVSTSYFDGLNPHGAFFYVDAYDKAIQDDGFINYVDFQVDWIDFANLTFYGNSSLNNKTVISQRFLSVNSAIYNNSDVDISDIFSMGWYAELDTSPSGNCSTLTYNPVSSDVWLVGYADFNGMPYNSYSNAYLNNIDLDLVAANGSGYYMNTGKYCLWAYADDLDEVFEWDETSEISTDAVAWDNITNLGGFQYTYQSYKPDLTFNYSSSGNKFIQGLTLNTSAAVYNDSITASVHNAGEIAWYFTALPIGMTCSSPSLVLDVNTAFFAGATTLPAIGARATVTVNAPASDLRNVQNPLGDYMENGVKYCLWAWVDDYNTVDEGNEDNNVIVYSNAYTYNDIGTGIKNNKNELSLNVYPNPADSFVRIELPLSLASKEFTVEVMSLNGQVVKSQVARGALVELQVSDLAVGQYIVSVRSEDGQTGIQKIIKQ